MIRHLINFVLPFFVVLCLFILVQFWQKNYNVLYTKSNSGKAMVIGKEFLPEGSYDVTRVVGQKIYNNKTWMPDRTIINLNFEGDNLSATVDKSLYITLQKGQEVNIWFEAPAYWGTPFNIHILNPKNPNHVKELEAIRTRLRKTTN